MRLKTGVVLAMITGLMAPAAADAGSGTAYFYERGAVQIPDGHGSAEVKFNALLPMDIDPTIDDVNLTLRIKHPRTRDLEISLKRPDFDYMAMGPQAQERVVTLSDHDTRGKNLGRGRCPGGDPEGPKPSHTTFDDAATSAISAGDPPYEGLFDPAEPLSSFNGYHAVPEPAREKWTLRVRDTEGGNAGRILCAGLFLSRI